MFKDRGITSTMKLSEIIRAVQTDLPITMRHERWLAANPNPVYSKDALEFAARALSGDFQFRKRELFRSSSTGMCERRRIFAAMGVAEPERIDAKLANIFQTGNMLHLKWQLAGLTEGWLADAEIAVDHPDLRFSGTLDGILHDGSGFEFKTINSYGHTFTWKEPKPLHVRQVHAYMVLKPEIEQFSVIYENKDTAEWREMRVQRDPVIYRSVQRELHNLNEMYDERKLPDPLDECRTRTGSTYRNCPFHEVCLSVKKWPIVIEGKVVGR